MAQLKENSTVTKNSQQNLIWHNAYEKILTTDIVPVESLSDNFTQLSVDGKITAHDLQTNEYFGTSIALSDIRIVVGAPKRFTNSELYAGGTYVYDIDGNFIKQLQAIIPTSGETFGDSVAISNNRIVIGGPGKDVPATNAGTAYIYDINGNLIKELVPWTVDGGDGYGASVACNDTRIVIGAPGDEDGGLFAGTFYVFDINGNQIAKVLTSDIGEYNYLGCAVAASDTRILVGARGNSTGSTLYGGSAYIFDLDGNRIAKIIASDPEQNAYFGYSVDISNTRIVVGAYGEDTNGANAGAAYVYDINGNFITKLLSPIGNSEDYFGWSVSCSDTRIVVGTTSENSKGGAYVYDIDGNELLKIESNDIANSDQFGCSVSITDARIAVGAMGETSNTGAVYMFNNFRNDLTEIISTVYNQTGIEFKVQG